MSVREKLHQLLGDPETFGPRTRSALRANMISQASFARELGMDEGRLSRYLNGQVAPSMDTMLRLHEALERLTNGP